MANNQANIGEKSCSFFLTRGMTANTKQLIHEAAFLLISKDYKNAVLRGKTMLSLLSLATVFAGLGSQALSIHLSYVVNVHYLLLILITSSNSCSMPSRVQGEYLVNKTWFPLSQWWRIIEKQYCGSEHLPWTLLLIKNLTIYRGYEYTVNNFSEENFSLISRNIILQPLKFTKLVILQNTRYKLIGNRAYILKKSSRQVVKT